MLDKGSGRDFLVTSRNRLVGGTERGHAEYTMKPYNREVTLENDLIYVEYTRYKKIFQLFSHLSRMLGALLVYSYVLIIS